MPAETPESANNLPPELELALISLTKADQDLVAVGKWLADPDISDEIIGFHIQQAIEKSLKAVLLYQAIDYPHTHNLGLLIDLCRNNQIQVPSAFLQVDIFNRFAVQWRYDLLPTTPKMALDRQAAYHLAEQVWNWAKNLVNETSQ
ncbi:MAG: DNA-binding protein [Chloroflexota bacterium]|nr:MAG: DNA-binding protein [Chloroflexota bacterium]